MQFFSKGGENLASELVGIDPGGPLWLRTFPPLPYHERTWETGAKAGLSRLMSAGIQVVVIKGIKKGQSQLLVDFDIGFKFRFSKLPKQKSKVLDGKRLKVITSPIAEKWKCCVGMGIKVMVDDRLLTLGSFPEHLRIAKILYKPDLAEISSQSEQVRMRIISISEIDLFMDCIWRKIIRVDSWTDLPATIFRLIDLLDQP